MRRLAFAVMAGLLGAGIVHILVLFLIPEFSERDAWARLAMDSGLYVMAPLAVERGGPPALKSVDPLFDAAACRFDLTDGIVRIRAPGKVVFWSMSIYDRNGHNIYSLNDHSTNAGLLNVVVLTPAQMVGVRRNLPEALEGSVFVEAPIDEGMAVVRSFVPDESWAPTVSRYLDQVTCQLQGF